MHLFSKTSSTKRARLDSHHRDMGPYVDVDLTHAEKLEVAWGSKQGSPRKMPAFPVPLLPKRMSYTIENDGIAYADEFVTCNRMSVADTQDWRLLWIVGCLSSIVSDARVKP